jgi:uncharacterized membrane protein (DUF106 family)
MVFESLLDPVFSPLLRLPPLAAIIIISLVIAVIIVVVYKFMTNQKEMKEMKEQIKGCQKEMKELRHDPKAMMAVQKKAMQVNMKYMMHSFKPTIITFIPIIIIFGWLNANLAFMPIMPDTAFTTTMFFEENVVGEAELIVPEEIELMSDAVQEVEDGKATWKLKGAAGEHTLEYRYDEKNYLKEVLITEQQAYKAPLQKVKNGGDVQAIQVNNKPLKLINLFGLKLGWIWTYIIFSVVFSMILRKILKIY